MAKEAIATSGIEWDIVTGENTDFTEQYPRFQWVHGNAQATGFMKTGGLFVSAENYPNFTGKGFAPETLITRDGDSIEGFGAKRAELAVIRIKDQWIKTDEGKNVPLLHALAVVNGCDDVICISLRGASKSLAFDKAFKSHISQNISFANRTRPQGVPGLEPFALWFPICAGELQDANSKDGKSKSKVTPIELCTPATLDRDYVTTLWVGRDNYTRFAGVFQDTKKWQHTKIWDQQHNADDPDAPTHTGDPDSMTEGQASLIVGCLEAKGIDGDEFKQMVLTATQGATSNYRTLKRDEAAELIEVMKAY